MMSGYIRVILVTLVSLFLFMENNVQAKDNKRVAVLEVTAKNAPKVYADIVRDILEINLHKSKKFEVLERTQMELILKEQNLQQSGCMDISCAVKIGKFLSADLVVVGSLFKITKYTISLKFIDVAKGNIILADTEKAETEDDIDYAVDRLIDKIVKEISGETVEAAREPEVVLEEEAISVIEPIEIPEFKRDVKTFNVKVSINPYGSYLFPSGDFTDLVDQGFGGMINGGVEFYNFNFGVQSGYWKFSGKDDNIDFFSMIPVLFSVGYRFNPVSWLSIMPVISGGASYNSIRYIHYLQSIDWVIVKNDKIEPFAKGGLNLGLFLNKDFQINIGAEYGSIFEKDGRLEFMLINAGVGLWF